MSAEAAARKVVKIVELVGVSPKSWSDGARNAVEEASRTLRGITGLDVVHSTAVVRDGRIVEYHTTVKIAFAVEAEREEKEADEEHGEEEVEE